jgi:hypothetical protein
MLGSRRRELHGRLADRFEAGGTTATAGRIAAHWVAAGDITRAIPLLRAAAESALALGGPAEAGAFWRQAADLSAADDPEGAARDHARAATAMESIGVMREAAGLEPAASAVRPGTDSAPG